MSKHMTFVSSRINLRKQIQMNSYLHQITGRKIQDRLATHIRDKPQSGLPECIGAEIDIGSKAVMRSVCCYCSGSV